MYKNKDLKSKIIIIDILDQLAIYYLQAFVIYNYLFFFMIEQTRSLTTLQKIWNTCFNIRYKIIGVLQSYDKDSIAKPGDIIYYLGNEIKFNKQNLEAQIKHLYQQFNRTPWFTYRSGFPQIYHDIKGTYVTDTGWGCMIRVGQMLFAQIIKEHEGVRNYEQMLQILKLFSDFDKKQPFSIHNISKLARRQFGILPGDWYNPSQIAHILSILNKSYLQTKNKLTFIAFNSGNLFFDQIIDVMVGEKQNCNCQLKIDDLICQKCNISKMSIGLVILTRIGLYSPQQKYLKVLIKLLKLKNSKGMIGGRPGKALYFLGTYNEDSLIYLDPHYVHEANKSTEYIKQTYFCESFRICKTEMIDPSIGLCYYIKDLNQLNNFYRQITKIRDEKDNQIFIWVNDVTPSYLSKTMTISKPIQLEQDEYQQL